jgi:hypothetical protein
MDAFLPALVFGLCFTAVVVLLLVFKIKSDQRQKRKAPGGETANHSSNRMKKT